MKNDGFRMMPLFVRWCDSEWVSKLESKIDIWVALVNPRNRKKSQNL